MIQWTPPTGNQIRYCLKVTLAAVIAYAMTWGDRDKYALYSVITAALVLGNNTGEDLKTTQDRLLGTLLGAVIGILAGLCYPQTSVFVLAAALLLTSFVAILIGWNTAAKPAITVCAVLLMLHQGDSTVYGFHRAANTCVGAIIGLAVGFFVWPVRSQEAVRTSIRKVLMASSGVLEAVCENQPENECRARRRQTLDELSALFKALKDSRQERAFFRQLAVPAREARAVAEAGLGSLQTAAALYDGHTDPVPPELNARIRQCSGEFAVKLKLAADAAPRVESSAEFAQLRVEAQLSTNAFSLLNESMHGLALIESSLQSLYPREEIAMATGGTGGYTMEFLPGLFGLCQLAPAALAPEWLPRDGFVKLVRTDEETSIVCPMERIPKDVKHDADWECLKVQGPFALTAVGVLASILQPLAQADVSVFAVSTFNTDYILLKSSQRDRAIESLTRAGHLISNVGACGG